MKLIIDISKDAYEEICLSCKFFTEFEHNPNVYQTIANGKPYKERPTGEWKYYQYDANPDIGNWHCSNCRCIVFGEYNQKPNYNFCPSCGADMKGGTE